MCERCGFTDAEFRRAEWLERQASWTALYLLSRWDPTDMGIEQLSKAQCAWLGRVMEAQALWHTDPDAVMSPAELQECFDRSEKQRARAKMAFTLAGC